MLKVRKKNKKDNELVTLKRVRATIVVAEKKAMSFIQPECVCL